MAVYAHDGLGATYTGFALSYAVARAVITFMWGWATLTSPPFRATGRWYTGAFSISIVLVIGSVFVPSPLNLILLGAAFLIDLLAPIVTVRLQRSLPAFSTSRLPTRFGLFTIVVWGETVVGVVNGLAEMEGFGAELFVNAALGLPWGSGCGGCTSTLSGVAAQAGGLDGTVELLAPTLCSRGGCGWRRCNERDRGGGSFGG